MGAKKRESKKGKEGEESQSMGEKKRERKKGKDEEESQSQHTYVAIFAFSTILCFPQICNTSPNLFSTIFKNLEKINNINTGISFWPFCILECKENQKRSNPLHNNQVCSK